jgi:hypothetical protein
MLPNPLETKEQTLLHKPSFLPQQYPSNPPSIQHVYHSFMSFVST